MQSSRSGGERPKDDSESEQKYHKRVRVMEPASNAPKDYDDTESLVDIFEEVTVPDSTTAGLEVIASTIRRTMLEIHEVKERNAERRHRELLQVLGKLTKGSSAMPASVPLPAQHQKKDKQTSSDDLKPPDDKDGLIIPIEVQDETSPPGSPAAATAAIGDHYAVVHCQATTAMDTHSHNGLQSPEFQILRSRIMATQRQKMEDREHKKLGVIKQTPPHTNEGCAYADRATDA